MKGLGKFQMEQMKHRDARVFMLCQHLRSAIDILEPIASDPYQLPAKPVSGSVTLVPSAHPAPPAMLPERIAKTIIEASDALSVGKTTVHKALATGGLCAKKLGSQTLISADAPQR